LIPAGSAPATGPGDRARRSREDGMALDLISVDDHIIEHARVWTDRLPAKLRDEGPHVIDADDREYWVYEGERFETMGLNAVAGRAREDFSTDPIRFNDMIPGCYDPAERVVDMDRDGVRASLGFPSFPRFCGQTFLVNGKDRDLALLCVRAWNDFVLDEWCATAPDRFIPMIIGPLWDPGLMADEVRRGAERGARALSFTENPSKLGLPSVHTDHWDPLWAACEETETVVCLHIGTSGSLPLTSPDAPIPVGIALAGTLAQAAMTDIVMSRIPHEFPRLKFVLSEGGIGWVPYALERADYTWEHHRFWAGMSPELKPSDAFRQSVWVCFIDDGAGLELRHRIGVDKIMWECDYPHSDSTWPRSQERAAEVLSGLPRDEIEAIAHANAESVFRFT
jgi:predicted TIM-barrel fold metal-dependent hydrolase